MSLDAASDKPTPVTLNDNVKVHGVIEPWHHQNPIPIPLKAGMSGTQMPDGTCKLACSDGRHTVITRNLPMGAFASL